MRFATLSPRRSGLSWVGEKLTLILLQFALWTLLAVSSPGMPTSNTTPHSGGATPSAQSQTTRNPHGPLSIPCENCHTSAGWRPIRAVPEFDHNKTKYPLRGMHEKVPCTQCHIQPVFANVSKNCADCHADIHRRQMGTDCAQCHTVKGWHPVNQQVKDHQNRFPLFGAHSAVPCESCHKSAGTGIYYGLSTRCDSCHLKDWQNTTNPSHSKAGPAFAPGNCQGCHNFDSWLGAKFDHSTTGFLLTNGHANVACEQCHVNNNYNLQIQPSDCGNSGCHLSTWQKTTNPPHPSAGPAFAASNCASCHTTVSWDTATFDHSTTGFQLTLGHANVACASCHVNNNYNLKTAPTDCGNSGCHLTRWQQTTNPVHSTSGPGFAPSNCANCHTPKGWDAASFDHAVTGFALVGTHLSPTPTPCAACHVNNNYTLNSADCMTCHTPDWNKTQTIGGNIPNHITSGFPSTASACSSCHTITTWADGKFDHSTTGFLLTDGHANVPCASCHLNNNYNLKTAPTDCGNSGCHLTKWQQTTTPVHSTSGPSFAAANCANCHTPKGWDSASFDHSSTGFALIGTHKTTPCASCHVNNNYSLTSADCLTCHQPDWVKTQTLGGNVPNHVASNFPNTASACSTCHTITVWADGKFDHSTTGFPLANSHQLAPAGKVTACTDCHVGGNYNLTTQPNDCGNSGCHLTTWQKTTNPTHSSSGAAFAAANCSTCHNTISWTTAAFDHSSTGFALTGTHMSPTPTPCVACHVNNNYTLSSGDCLSCHTPDWNKTQTLGGNVPNHVASNFPNTASACSSCHTITTWADGKFDHSTTGFPLANSHQLAPAGKVPNCTSCHLNGNYALSIQPNDCGNSGCHLTTWQQTNNPVHPSAGAPFAAANCSNCHNTITWTTATFDHSTTGWPLTNSHQLAPAGKVAACTDCHVNNNYTFTSANTDCYGCHLADWNKTQTLGGNVPNHVSAGFPTSQCSTCHNTLTWTNAIFDHNTTGFPLTNSHQLAPAGKAANCAACHINNNYALKIQPNDCGNSGCHLTTWQQTNNPTHSSAGAPFAAANCSTCHNTITWTTATFDHSTTGWALTGVHITTPCANCHLNNNYNFTTANTDCYGCHQDKYNSTATMGGAVPNHAAAGLPTAQCSTCHTTTNWTSTWNHNSTGFPLQNLHQFAPAGKVNACTDCHISNNYNLQITPTACGTSGCHLTTWQQTNNPTHSTAGAAFALANCSNCHTTAGWGTANFDHSTTGFPLTGTHVTTPCANCHVNNNYNLTSANTACLGCHTDKWNSTATLGGAVPNHVAAGFPSSLCSTCHNTTAWNPGTFDHSTTGWALTGAHQMPPAAGSKMSACTDCHINNNYSLTAANTLCYGCHQAAWTSTQTLGGTVPNHVAAGYPTTCETCHTTTSWLGATFNHTYFPIPHHKSVCNDCHQVSTNYASFTCINCHTNNYHTQTRTNGQHGGVNGYSYGPTTCYNCHKNGGGG